MVSTEIMKSGLALSISPTGSRLYPGYAEIGDGSGTVVSTRSGLVNGTASSGYSSVITTTPNEIEYTYDYTVSQMSGTTLREFGGRTASGLGTGDLWSYDSLSNPDTFNGTAELQLQITWQFK